MKVNEELIYIEWFILIADLIFPNPIFHLFKSLLNSLIYSLITFWASPCFIPSVICINLEQLGSEKAK